MVPRMLLDRRRHPIAWQQRNGSRDPVAAALAYVGFAGGLTFDALLGGQEGYRDAFRAPALTVTFHYDQRAEDTLVLSADSQRNHRLLLNETTGQVFTMVVKVAELNSPVHHRPIATGDGG